MTGADINKKLESFNNLIQEFGNTTFNSKEIWNRKKEIDENLKAAKFDTPEEKVSTINKFEKLIILIEQKEKEIETDNETFSVEGERLVNEFVENANKVLQQTTITKDDFKDLRILSNKAFEYFKQQRWVTKERRTNAWDKYNDVRNIVKDKEDDLFEKERETRTKQISQSLEITEKLCVVVDACHPNSAIENLQNFVIKFNDFLKENNLTENNKPWYVIEKPEDLKYSLRCRTETLNDVRNFITNYKDYLTREHKGQIFANIDNLKEDLNKAWETHKEERQKQQEEWGAKRVEWNKKQQEFLLFLEKRLENQKGYKAKQISYLASQKEFAKRFENRIPAQQEYIKKLVDQTIDLEKKYATAWTDSFKTKVEEWIKEKKDKITSVEADIEVLKEKVADINKNIEELPKKIEELDVSIKEIEEKIVEVKEKLANDVLPEKEEMKEEQANTDVVENTIVENVSSNEEEMKNEEIEVVNEVAEKE